MDFLVSDECVILGLRAGAVLFRGLHIESRGSALHELIVAECQTIRVRYKDAQDVRSLREVIAYQDILRNVGVNPRRAQPSVEKLLIFALKRGDLPTINSLVDAYNLVSVRSLCSLGAHDVDMITPPVTLRMLTGTESFTPLGAEKPEAVKRGEFGYVDAANRVLCRLDVLQADFSKVTTATRNALLIVEATAEHSPEAIPEAFDEVIALVKAHCGGTATIL